MSQTIEVSPADMLLFATVVREGSFSAAGRSLGMTKQSVSERVARLERVLGVRLLARTTRRMRPTDAGSAYAERCQAIATQIREANDAVRERQSRPTGTVRVASPVLFGRRFMAPVLAEFLAKFPDVHVEFTFTDRRVDLTNDGFDVAIQVGRLPDSPYVARRLRDSYLYLVASPSYLRTAHAKLGVLDASVIARARCLGMRPQEFWRVADVRVEVTPVAVVNDLETTAALAIAGEGIARLPSFLCDAALHDGRLVRLFPDAPASVRQIWVLYPGRRFLPAAVRRFLELLPAYDTAEK